MDSRQLEKEFICLIKTYRQVILYCFGLLQGSAQLADTGSVFFLCIVLVLYSNNNDAKNMGKIREAIKELKKQTHIRPEINSADRFPTIISN